MLAIAFTWAHRTGEWQNEQKPIKIKKHGRPAVSLFRYGLDFLCDSIVRLAYKTNHFQQARKILNSNTIARLYLIAYNLFADSSGLSYGKITVIRQK